MSWRWERLGKDVGLLSRGTDILQLYGGVPYRYPKEEMPGHVKYDVTLTLSISLFTWLHAESLSQMLRDRSEAWFQATM